MSPMYKENEQNFDDRYSIQLDGQTNIREELSIQSL